MHVNKKMYCTRLDILLFLLVRYRWERRIKSVSPTRKLLVLSSPHVAFNVTIVTQKRESGTVDTRLENWKPRSTVVSVYQWTDLGYIQHIRYMRHIRFLGTPVIFGTFRGIYGTFGICGAFGIWGTFEIFGIFGTFGIFGIVSAWAIITSYRNYSDPPRWTRQPSTCR